MVQNDMTLNHKYNLFWHSVCLFVCVWLFVYLFAAYDLWYKLRCQQDKEGKPVQWPPVLYLQKDGNCCWKTWPPKKEKRTPNNSGHSGGSKITKAPEEESVSPPILGRTIVVDIPWGLPGNIIAWQAIIVGYADNIKTSLKKWQKIFFFKIFCMIHHSNIHKRLFGRLKLVYYFFLE